MEQHEFDSLFVEANTSGAPLRNVTDDLGDFYGEEDDGLDWKDRFDVVEAWHWRLRGNLPETLHWLRKKWPDEFDDADRAAGRRDWRRVDDAAHAIERLCPPCFGGLAADILKSYRSKPQ